MFPATSEREKISFHQLNKETGNRIRYRKVDAVTGDDVESANIIKGYEVAKGASREHIIALEPRDKGMVGVTLRTKGAGTYQCSEPDGRTAPKRAGVGRQAVKCSASENEKRQEAN